MNTFSDLSLSTTLQANLARNQFVDLTAVQAQSIPPQLQGQDVVITAPTGTGKTFSFLLPLLEKIGAKKGLSALVLTPTRELAIQIGQSFSLLASNTGIRAAVVVGGMSEQSQLQAIRRDAQVIIATPGRLDDFLNRRLVQLSTVETVILDEADRMFDMGFLPTIEKILALLPKKRQTVFCSATIEASVARVIKAHLQNPVRIAIGSITRPAENINLHVYEVEQDHKLGLLRKMLADETGSFLVFARTKHGADRLAKKIDTRDSRATSIHGNRTQSQRNQALRGFQDGSYRVLVATDVAARGVHVEGIAHVVNYDLPQVSEDFIHRVGRTGRAGRSGTASTFSTRNERSEIRRIEKLLEVQLTRQQLPAGLEQEAHSMERTAVVHSRPMSSKPSISSKPSNFSKPSPFSKPSTSYKPAGAPKHTGSSKPASSFKPAAGHKSSAKPRGGSFAPSKRHSSKRMRAQ